MWERRENDVICRNVLYLTGESAPGGHIMKTVSRRKFIKGALTVIALLPAARIVKAAPAMQKDAVLTVDKDGNATLHGMTLAVDRKNNATVK
jgi:hypothetical protein